MIGPIRQASTQAININPTAFTVPRRRYLPPSYVKDPQKATKIQQTDSAIVRYRPTYLRYKEIRHLKTMFIRFRDASE
jgi:hypothetical protein